MLQGSLFDQAEGADDISLGGLDGMRRTVLGDGAWIDVLPGWLRGADEVYERLARDVPWKAERRQMYERMVDVPRLLKFYGAGGGFRTPCSTRRATRCPRTTPRS